jgi:hypothetical protein
MCSILARKHIKKISKITSLRESTFIGNQNQMELYQTDHEPKFSSLYDSAIKTDIRD